MNFITGKHISRRTVLRGMGATFALPFLDAMAPAGQAWSKVVKATGLDKTRLVTIEMVHGAAGCNDWGAKQFLWAPEVVGRDFDLSPSALSPLEAYRDHLTIVSNTDCRMAEAFEPSEIGADHFRSSAIFLTQAHPKQTRGSDVYVGTSMDQLYAQRFGGDTPIPSMQLCIENVDQSGGCAYGYSCVYTDMISWASPTEPLPMIRDPRVAFDMLFGVGGSAADRSARRRTNRSILDWIAGEVTHLKRDVGASDVHRLDQYLDNVREIERRIQGVEAQNASGEPRDLPGAPAGVPDSFDQHMKLMFDLQALAFEADMTRVFSLKVSRDASSRVYPDSETDRPFHPSSHHGGRAEAILEFNKINKYHASLLPYFMEKLENIVEGDAHLLDKTMIIYGSPMGDANLHNHRRCPLIVLGGANGQLQGGQHLKAPDGTPMANVMLSLMHKLGLDDMNSFGDSTGEFLFSPPMAQLS
jgi:hypothetical protein